MKHTKRDQLWYNALALTGQAGDEITSKGLAEETDTNERTARDVLKTMADMGVVTPRKDGKRTLYRISEGWSFEE
jgi:predicted transcriptional regulator